MGPILREGYEKPKNIEHSQVGVLHVYTNILLTIDYPTSELPQSVGEGVVTAGDEDILLAAPQKLPAIASRGCSLRFGTVGNGPDLARLAWSKSHHVFSLQDRNMERDLPHRPKTPELILGRLKEDFLNRN